MSTHRYMGRICCVVLVLTLLTAVLFCNGERLGLQRADRARGYEARLFDTSRVHTIDIVMDDWEGFLEGCEDEEYQSCAVVVDNEAYKNVALRAKGNTSLNMVKSYGNNRYSLKIEFDHYDAGNTYYGLDKLCLNNIIQDNTYMKDYIAYTLMRESGVASPLCSFAYLTVNGEDWGLYLAVEAVEDGFLARNYGSGHGALYKPDSMGFGGGRGNGRDFRMDDLGFGQPSSEDGGFPAPPEGFQESSGFPALPEGFPEGSGFPDMPEGFPEGFGRAAADAGSDARPFDSGERGTIPAGGNPAGREGTDGQGGGMPEMGETAPGEAAVRTERGRRGGPGGGGPGGGMGSSDVMLQYIDDDPDSYANIFDNAKTAVTDADQARLIASLKKLSEQEDLESVVKTDEVIRYFAVHDFLCNDDSYTGSIVHNYYLYEKDGQLSMIPWDYNLSFGTMGGGSDAADAVNSPIDSPVSGTLEDRPMAAWIFSSEEYTAQYHQAYAQLVELLTENDSLAELIRTTSAMIAPYVERDPTKFCTYEEFETGVETLLSFCALRLESVAGQLNGTIPTTSDGQQQDSTALVDASAIRLSDMGSMQNGGGPGGFGGRQRGQADGQPVGGNGGAGGAVQDGDAGISKTDGAEDGAPATGNAPASGAGSANGTSPAANGPDAENDSAPSREAARQQPGGFGQNQQRGEGDGFPEGQQGAAADRMLLLGVSLAVLLAGLLIAVKFRR